MLQRSVTLRIAVGVGAAALVVVAIMTGASLTAVAFRASSETSAHVRSGVLGGALVQSVLPAATVGAFAAYVSHPVNRNRRRRR